MSLLRASAVMAAGTLASRILGFVKAMILTLAIGLNALPANAFDVANKVPNSVYMLVAGGFLNAVLVPQVVRAAKHHDGGADYLNRLVTFALLVLGGLTLVMTLGAPWLISLYSQGWNADQLAMAVGFAYLCLPQVFFYGLSTVLGQILNARGSFGPYGWAPAVNNVIGIAGLVVFIALFGRGDHGQHSDPLTWTPTMIWVLAGTATLGVVAQTLVLIPALRSCGFHYRPRFGFRGVGLGAAGRIASWTFSAVVIGQVVYVLTSKVCAAASAHNSGDPVLESATAGNAAYTYAFLMFMLPHSLVAVSLVTAQFTKLSQDAAEGDLPGVRHQISLGVRTLAVASTLATAGLIALHEPIGRALIAGPFESAQALGRVMAAMALGLLPFSSNYLFQRVFYAFEDGRSPFLAQLPTYLVIVVSNLVAWQMLPPTWMVVGVGVGMSLGNLAGAVTAWLMMKRLVGTIDQGAITRLHLRLAVVGLGSVSAGGLVAWAMDPITRSGQLGGATTTLVGGAVVVGMFLVLCRLFAVREVQNVMSAVTRRLSRAR